MWPFNQKPTETAQNLAAGAPASGGPLSIGDRPMSLAFQLRRVADALDGGLLIYSWGDAGCCNAGLLVRAMTGWSPEKLLRERMASNCATGLWQDTEKAHTDACFFNPGVKMPEFLETLRGLGLRAGDLAHVEELDCPELWAGIKMTCLGKPARNEAGNVAKYFRNWAEKIKVFHAQTTSAVPMASPVPTDAQVEAAETRPLVSA